MNTVANRPRNLLLIIIPILVIIVIASVFSGKWFDNEPLNAQQIKSSNEPDLIAQKFLEALVQDNVYLAKELVIPEKRERIDKWKIDSHHRAFECPYDSRYFWDEPIQNISSGGTGTVVIDDKTVKAFSSFGCNNNNRSMRVDNMIIRNDPSEWIIIDWNEICETPASYDEKETCYP